jgi:hypothetical protein
VHAKQHLLQPDPQTGKFHIIPKVGKITIQIVETMYGLSTNATVEGFDLSPFRDYRQTGAMAVDIQEGVYTPLCHPIDIFTFDFESDPLTPTSQTFHCTALANGVVNGVHLWWSLYLKSFSKT